jgi:hypothetical protein
VDAVVHVAVVDGLQRLPRDAHGQRHRNTETKLICRTYIFFCVKYYIADSI